MVEILRKFREYNLWVYLSKTSDTLLPHEFNEAFTVKLNKKSFLGRTSKKTVTFHDAFSVVTHNLQCFGHSRKLRWKLINRFTTVFVIKIWNQHLTDMLSNASTRVTTDLFASTDIDTRAGPRLWFNRVWGRKLKVSAWRNPFRKCHAESYRKEFRN